MEVHAHTHTARKKWTHYFWEFTMMFLAVFAGFLAENIREHQVEHSRAKELAKSLYYELQSDSTRVKEVIGFRTARDSSLTYLKRYFHDSSLTNPSKKFYAEFLNGVYGILSSVFEPKDAMLNQLRNSGSLRYFKNMDLQKSLADISLAINNIRQRNSREMGYFNDYNVPFLIDHLDTQWLDEVTDNGKIPIDSAVKLTRENMVPEMPKFFNYDEFKKVKAVNWIGYGQLIQRNTIKKYFNVYLDINKKVLQLLREEYHISPDSTSMK
jgi:hypothetical protein